MHCIHGAVVKLRATSPAADPVPEGDSPCKYATQSATQSVTQSDVLCSELCENGGGRPGLPVPDSRCGLCGRSATVKERRPPCCRAGCWPANGVIPRSLTTRCAARVPEDLETLGKRQPLAGKGARHCVHKSDLNTHVETSAARNDSNNDYMQYSYRNTPNKQ